MFALNVCPMCRPADSLRIDEPIPSTHVLG
jgi:hypothetical protein